MNREILTFQLGNYSNYIGSHWWNIQESGFSYDPAAEPSDINHDILFREGINHQGYTTYTPRVLSVDLKGCLKHMPECGELYLDSFKPPTDTPVASTSDPTLLWDLEKLNVLDEEPMKKPVFQQDLDNPNGGMLCDDYDFSNKTETWTDFLVSRYHPRTINLIRSYEHSDNDYPFDCITSGMITWKEEDFEEEFGDRIRQYTEECDNCQGFQMIFDCTNAFAGIALKCLEHLSDEYSKVKLAIPVFNPKPMNFRNADLAMTESIRVVNIAMTYAKLIEQSDLILPLSTMGRNWRSSNSPRQFPLINYMPDNMYETSAILATFLDTISLRYRLKSPTSSNSLSGFCTDLNNSGRKLAGAALALPFKMNVDTDLIDCLDKQDGPIFTQLSPNTTIGTDRVIQSTFVRGIPKNRLKRPLKAAKEQMKMAAYKCDSISEMFQLYFQCNNYASMAHVAAISTGMPIKVPFPDKIFEKRCNFEGFLNDFVIPDAPVIQSVPVLASAQVSAGLSNTLETLHREAERIKIARLNCFKQSGLDSDEYKDALSTLLDFKDIYDDISQL